MKLKLIFRNVGFLDKKWRLTQPIYGINTGFGSLCNVKISNENLSKLQENLVKSHACGTEEVPKEIVKLMLLLKIQSLGYGHSGIQLQCKSSSFFNNDILPVIYTRFIRASGDLAPLAHLSLPLLGEGEVYFEGAKVHSSIMERFDWQPIVLQSKEGLAYSMELSL
jgi:histidine ammonia-lyase